MPDAANFEKSVAQRKVTVAVVGLGYVGLPLAIACAEAGFHVRGFDTDAAHCSEVNQGNPPLVTVSGKQLSAVLTNARFQASADPDIMRGSTVFIICVPTPLDAHRRPDLSCVIAAGREISQYLSSGCLVSLESSTYPGTTQEVLAPELSQKGLRAGKNFFLAYSPEREDPGNKQFTTSDIPKVVGADSEEELRAAVSFYGAVFHRIVPVSSCKVAEAAKMLENTYRAVNISLVNELKAIYDRMGIDVWEVISAASTKPFGFTPFYPGPGMGGHCIPVDPVYLAYRARELGVPSRFIELASSINRSMPEYVVGKLETALAERGKVLAASRILVLGVAYKPDISDVRESPAFSILRLLAGKRGVVAYNDPYVPKLPRHRGIPSMVSLELSVQTLASFDAAILVTAHSSFDYRLIADNSRLIVDTRNAFARILDARAEIVKA
ncbi:MAG: nucleotide sugar dehydrogenase [Candidatus Brocadiia bacterium]